MMELEGLDEERKSRKLAEYPRSSRRAEEIQALHREFEDLKQKIKDVESNNARLIHKIYTPVWPPDFKKKSIASPTLKSSFVQRVPSQPKEFSRKPSTHQKIEQRYLEDGIKHAGSFGTSQPISRLSPEEVSLKNPGESPKLSMQSSPHRKRQVGGKSEDLIVSPMHGGDGSLKHQTGTSRVRGQSDMLVTSPIPSIQHLIQDPSFQSRYPTDTDSSSDEDLFPSEKLQIHWTHLQDSSRLSSPQLTPILKDSLQLMIHQWNDWIFKKLHSLDNFVGVCHLRLKAVADQLTRKRKSSFRKNLEESPYKANLKLRRRNMNEEKFGKKGEVERIIEEYERAIKEKRDEIEMLEGRVREQGKEIGELKSLAYKSSATSSKEMVWKELSCKDSSIKESSLQESPVKQLLSREYFSEFGLIDSLERKYKNLFEQTQVSLELEKRNCLNLKEDLQKKELEFQQYKAVQLLRYSAEQSNTRVTIDHVQQQLKQVQQESTYNSQLNIQLAKQLEIKNEELSTKDIEVRKLNAKITKLEKELSIKNDKLGKLEGLLEQATCSNLMSSTVSQLSPVSNEPKEVSQLRLELKEAVEEVARMKKGSEQIGGLEMKIKEMAKVNRLLGEENQQLKEMMEEQHKASQKIIAQVKTEAASQAASNSESMSKLVKEHNGVVEELRSKIRELEEEREERKRSGESSEEKQGQISKGCPEIYETPTLAVKPPMIMLSTIRGRTRDHIHKEFIRGAATESPDCFENQCTAKNLLCCLSHLNPNPSLEQSIRSDAQHLKVDSEDDFRPQPPSTNHATLFNQFIHLTSLQEPQQNNPMVLQPNTRLLKESGEWVKTESPQKKQIKGRSKSSRLEIAHAILPTHSLSEEDLLSGIIGEQETLEMRELREINKKLSDMSQELFEQLKVKEEERNDLLKVLDARQSRIIELEHQLDCKEAAQGSIISLKGRKDIMHSQSSLRYSQHSAKDRNLTLEFEFDEEPSEMEIQDVSELFNAEEIPYDKLKIQRRDQVALFDRTATYIRSLKQTVEEKSKRVKVLERQVQNLRAQSKIGTWRTQEGKKEPEDSDLSSGDQFKDYESMEIGNRKNKRHRKRKALESNLQLAKEENRMLLEQVALLQEEVKKAEEEEVSLLKIKELYRDEIKKLVKKIEDQTKLFHKQHGPNLDEVLGKLERAKDLLLRIYLFPHDRVSNMVELCSVLRIDSPAKDTLIKRVSL